MQLAEKAVRHYFDFKGRAGIREFILAHIMIALVNVCLLAVLLGLAFFGNFTVSVLSGPAASASFLDWPPRSPAHRRRAQQRPG